MLCFDGDYVMGDIDEFYFEVFEVVGRGKGKKGVI